MLGKMIGMVLGILFVALGLALALDYRGVATKHVAFSMGLVRPLTLSRRLERMDERLVRRRRLFVALDRLIGLLIIPAGFAMIVVEARDVVSN